MNQLFLFCDRCRTHQPTARSYSTGGVFFTLCDSCHREFYRPETSEHPKDPRDVVMEWLF